MNLFRILIVICVLLLAVDVANLALHFFHHHGKFQAEALPNFYGFFGLAACLLLAAVSGGLRHRLMRGEDYYDDDVD